MAKNRGESSMACCECRAKRGNSRVELRENHPPANAGVGSTIAEATALERFLLLPLVCPLNMLASPFRSASRRRSCSTTQFSAAGAAGVVNVTANYREHGD
jgi:hypothetical protein